MEAQWRIFHQGSKPNPNRDKIKGVVCGVRVEAVEEQPMREICLLDKLIDELAKGKAMEQIFANSPLDEKKLGLASQQYDNSLVSFICFSD